MQQKSNFSTIEWTHPEPHSFLDRFIGPGATRAELLLQLIPPVFVASALPLVAKLGDWGWNFWQMLIAAILAFDLLGGVITNATSSAKRWYHRAGQGFREHLGFVLLHIVQLLILVLAFDAGNWIFVVGGYGYLAIASLLVLLVPLYLQRPMALLLLVGGIFLGLYLLPVPPHFEWFLPVFYTKLLVSHLLHEEPYRPISDETVEG